MSNVPCFPCCYADNEAPTFVESYETTALAPPLEYHSHADADWEIQWVYGGRSSVNVDGRSYPLGAGEILIIDPSEPHGCESSLGRRRVVTFRETALRWLPFEARPAKRSGLRIEGRHLPPRLAMPSHARPALDRLIVNLERESWSCESLGPAMCGVLLAQLLLVLARTAEEAASEEIAVSPAALRTVEQFCSELRDNLDYPWTLPEMVRRSGYSAPQLSRLFGQVTSLSPCRWLREERVRSARGLLVETDKKMAEIAVEVGFDSRFQFHRVFREVVGVSPNEYRELMRPNEVRQESSHL